MPRFAANLSMLFTEVPFLDRFERAARAGFEAVEFLFPYAHTVQEIKERVDAHGLQIVLHNLPAGDWDAGERGIACHPDRVDEFRAGVAKAVTYGHALGVPQLNCLAGKAPAGADAALLRRTFVDNLRFAASALSAASSPFSQASNGAGVISVASKASIALAMLSKDTGSASSGKADLNAST